MNKILLTGGTGFVGSNILDELVKKNFVTVILRKNNYELVKKCKINSNLKLLRFNNFDNLNKKIKNKKFDYLIHCATHYVKNHNDKDLKNLANANILLGNIMLNNLKNMHIKKFINFSTVWEDFDGIKNNSANLYSAYKKAFSVILDYYKKINPNTKFYNIIISDTFGSNDKRVKLINVLKKNFKNNKITKIVSKNMSMNLLNVKDVVDAIIILLKKKIKPGKYLIKNKKNYKIIDIISTYNKNAKTKIKIKWLSNKFIKEKIYSYPVLPGWSPKLSNINNIINNIVL